MPSRLKVYRTHLGFYDTIVAAPSQRAALAAWGAPAGEFRKGRATVTDDRQAVRCATAKPGVVLRRPFGSALPFVAEPVLPNVKRHRRRNGGKASPPAKANSGREKCTREEEAKKDLQTELDRIDEQERELVRARRAAREEYKSRLKG